ncbi:MAG TPA: lipopolysaccharide heptosyltransferase I [Thiolapillus brandeum]|uniref:Lipopolysaccharide heptosyltransferase 1 n=1 Tax=Thiolapillus brandeum TaxID=1076588 RepID=A0A831KC57_9GAMM|nr:lipopolysaccharide heptosyltransferase I [Thiolapillus brandeum]
MRVLIIKTSSLGDVIHTFPAVTDAMHAFPDIELHWLVEEAFVQVPTWHPAIDRSISIALRRWRQNWKKAWKTHEISQFRSALKRAHYDLVIDAQGLLKSALPARLASGVIAGYDRHSLREPLASLFYSRRYSVSRNLHAVERIRRLFALALDYPLPDSAPESGLARHEGSRDKSLVFLHSTTWPSKHWPVEYWAKLTELAEEAGYRVLFPWYEPEERLRVEQIMSHVHHGELLPRMDLNGLKKTLSQTGGVVGLDTGLAHLAAALNTPAVTLYGPTVEGLTGAVGAYQKNLQVDFACAPCLQRQCSYMQASPVQPACFQTLPPLKVWNALQQQMALA